MVVVRHLALVCACLMIGACTGALRWTPETHVVRSGETIYTIAFEYGIDQRDLLGWNNLDTNGLIFAGQRLRLTPPEGDSGSRPSSTTNRQQKTATASGKVDTTPVNWRWPTDGAVISAFGATVKTESGVHIAGKRGQQIHAAAGGQVVYAGSGLPGYGQLLIIKHTSDYLSAYGHNQQLLVGEGDRVSGGQMIAKMGEGPGQRPLLHFEIRRAGKPVNPLKYLPKR